MKITRSLSIIKRALKFLEHRKKNHGIILPARNLIANNIIGKSYYNRMMRERLSDSNAMTHYIISKENKA